MRSWVGLPLTKTHFLYMLVEFKLKFDLVLAWLPQTNFRYILIKIKFKTDEFLAWAAPG